jgi:hypothetical protein
MGFEPLPGQDTTPRDEATDAFASPMKTRCWWTRRFWRQPKSWAMTNAGRQRRGAERRTRAARRRACLPLDYKELISSHTAPRWAWQHRTTTICCPAIPDDDRRRIDDACARRWWTMICRKRRNATGIAIVPTNRETGLHTLFLIYGVVQWYDEQTGDDPQPVAQRC